MFWTKSCILNISSGISLVFILITSSGCAVGSAASGYSMKAGTADDLKSATKKIIEDETIEKAMLKCKEYVDQNCVKKDQK